jgi:molybdopterin/thiamine biosynthesis adenylyltransferase
MSERTPRRRRWSVALAERVDAELRAHLLRGDGQEDLCFALYTPSTGAQRTTALIQRVILPDRADRQVHGNVSFNAQYLHRVAQDALRDGLGVVFLHSHIGPGWQSMSGDDVRAERLKIGPFVDLRTGHPLIGMTLGTDGAWSARTWEFDGGTQSYERQWADSVRVVGSRLLVTFCDELVPPPTWRELFRRTATVWGPTAHRNLARLRVGIVGVGSVGMLVAKALAKMGLTEFVLTDFDFVEAHNLDRLDEATSRDIGRQKVAVARRMIHRYATAERVRVRVVNASVAEKIGYRAALDCDVIFSCVDRPRARSVLNHIAYAHLIPVVDGGIDVRFRDGACTGADWQVQTVGPNRACLDCIGAFSPADVGAEIEGALDDPEYLRGLPADHRFKRNENVFPLSANLASLEVLQLIALATGVAGLTDLGVQRFRMMPGIMSATTRTCMPGCLYVALSATADRHVSVTGLDHAAQRARERSTPKRTSNGRSQGSHIESAAGDSALPPEGDPTDPSIPRSRTDRSFHKE